MQNGDYFALEQPIVDQLKTIDGIEAVYTHFSIEDMMQGTAASPSVSVIYIDDRIGEALNNGQVNCIYQQWLIVLAVEEAGSKLENTIEIRKKASPFIIENKKKLQGFDADLVGIDVLQRANAGVQHMSAAGKLWMPFLFEAKIFNVN